MYGTILESTILACRCATTANILNINDMFASECKVWQAFQNVTSLFLTESPDRYTKRSSYL